MNLYLPWSDNSKTFLNFGSYLLEFLHRTRIQILPHQLPWDVIRVCIYIIIYCISRKHIYAIYRKIRILPAMKLKKFNLVHRYRHFVLELLHILLFLESLCSKILTPMYLTYLYHLLHAVYISKNLFSIIYYNIYNSFWNTYIPWSTRAFRAFTHIQHSCLF